MDMKRENDSKGPIHSSTTVRSLTGPFTSQYETSFKGNGSSASGGIMLQ